MMNVVPCANQYLNYLRKEGIIEWINYSAGRNSRLYRLCDEGKTEYRAISDRKIIRRIEQNNYKIRLGNSKKYPHLNKSIRKVELDYAGALKTVELEYNNNLDNNNAEGRRTFSYAAISKIESGEIYFKVNATNGRLDSNYTSLPGELLKHLTIDGQPLREMDISNAQPFFVVALFRPTLEIENLMRKFLGNSLTMLVKTLDIFECEDVKRYTLLVTTGKFYDFMMTKFKEHNITFTGRKDLKQQLFVVFFGKNYAYKYSPAAKLFKRIFPNVQRLFDTIKKDHYNKLAIFLQRIESYTMLERVTKNIELELPELPLLTKHDSVLPFGSFTIMVGKDMDKVKTIMVNTIKEVIGFAPQGRMKKYPKI
ncbi:MAG: hypothetical protein KAX05_16875 [Bacteroidales bacterium]|nr:hypothetical protein [Bacteroidales bacterium]